MISNKPKISILIPTFNRPEYLKEAIESVLEQDYYNIEIIISNDGEDVKTEKVVKYFQKKFPKLIKYVKNNRYLKGPTGNKNNAIDTATGDIYIILDDDDKLFPNVLNDIVQKILDGYDIVIANCIRSDNGYWSGKGLLKSGEIDWKDFFCGKLTGEFLIAFTNHAIKNLRFDSDLYGGEGVLWRKLIMGKKIYYLHIAARWYRIHPQSVTHKSIRIAQRIIKNYERDIEYHGKEMRRLCPCYLATIYKGAAYYAKLSSQMKKGFDYLLEAMKLCPKYKSSYLMLFAMLLPKWVIPWISKIRAKL